MIPVLEITSIIQKHLCYKIPCNFILNESNKEHIDVFLFFFSPQSLASDSAAGMLNRKGYLRE